MIFEGVEPTPKMQVAFSTVFGPLKDHPSQATPRAGGEDMLGVIEMRHEPNEPGTVLVDGQLLSQWLPWHFDHCYNDQLNRAGVLRAVEVPPEGGLDRLRRRHRPLRRDLARGARPDRGRDRDLRDGRDPGEPPVRSAGRFRRGRAAGAGHRR